jgi:hypothetical protein
MPKSIFSQYKQGENRVTASILAVFEKISFRLVEKILQILCEDANQSLLTFENQVKTSESVPDARIQGSFVYLIETKIVPNAFPQDHPKHQLRMHLQALREESANHKRLFVLTPDRECPKIIDEIRADQSINGTNLIRWASFDDLYEAIQEVTASNDSEDGESWLESDLPIVTEQERFLLRELVQMLFAERLIGLDSSDSVLVVPARTAVLEYKAFAAYMCQPNRAFRPVSYIAFYHNGKINRHIAKVLEKPIEETTLTEEGIANIPNLPAKTKQMFQELVIKMNADNTPKYKDLNLPHKVFFLSASDSPDTIVLDGDITNDLTNLAGNRYAFVQGQRYVSLAAFKNQPKTTSELLGR